MPRPHAQRVVGSLLVLLVALAFWTVFACDFTSYDDDIYVTRNPAVRAGLTSSSFLWAWTTGYAANWHPLTWISHMLDWQIYGPAAWGHHLTSLVLHAANVLLLFLLLDRMTRALWPSAFVAALFAIHPLHVESVAWVAERKDVLSTLLGFLTIAAYLGYVKSPSLRAYGSVLAFYALGLASKPMLVTLPIVLLLLDFWPLGRFVARPEAPGRGPVLLTLLREKLPLFAMAAASGVVTFFVQRAGGTMDAVEEFRFVARVFNALVSYVAYLGATLWPAGLSAFYPHPGETIAPWKTVCAALLLLLFTVVAVRERGRRPYLLFGWLWYVVTLLPVIGLVQVGGQARADRYTYVPLIGIFVIVAWGARDALRVLDRPRSAAGASPHRVVGTAIAAGGIVAALAAMTHVQVGYWRDSITLFTHALAVTKNNLKTHNDLGIVLFAQGRVDEAIEHFEAALRVNPGYSRVHFNLGLAYAERGRTEEAVSQYSDCLRLEPDFPQAMVHLGVALAELDRTEEAIEQYARALRIKPDLPEAHNYLGVALASRGELREAVAHFSEAVRLQPDFVNARYNLIQGLFATGDYAGAWRAVHAARRERIDPPARYVRPLSEKMPEPLAGE